MSLTYAQLKTTLANLIAQSESDTDFLQYLPSVIDQAEGQIYRDLDLLGTVVIDSSTSLSAGTRNVTMPTPASGRYRVLDGINLVISSSRTPLTPVSLYVLDTLWPSSTAPSTTATPTYFAMITDVTLAVGPTLGAAAGTATLEFLGRVTPTALSVSNTTTYLSLYYPDLLVAACMVSLSGYMRNFGAQADDPKMAQSWAARYQQTLAGANLQEARRRFASASWTSAPPEPAATNQRG